MLNVENCSQVNANTVERHVLYREILVSARVSLFLVFIPLLEFLFMRVLLHRGMQVKIGFWGMTDGDILFPGMFAFFLMVFSLGRAKPLTLGFQKRETIAHTLFFTLFMIATISFGSLRESFPTFFLPVWFALALTTFLSALFIWVSPSEILCHPNRRVLIPCLLVAGSKLISSHLLLPLSNQLLTLTSKVTFTFLSPFFSSLSLNEIYAGPNRFMRIEHPLHTLAIGIGCSGIDGIALGLFALLVSCTLAARRYSVSEWFFIMVASIPYMALVNVLRMIVLFLIPVVVVSIFGTFPHAARVVFMRVHDLLGWVSFTIGLFFFYAWFLPARFSFDLFRFPTFFPANQK